jgi:uncharacterized protein YkwD
MVLSGCSLINADLNQQRKIAAEQTVGWSAPLAQYAHNHNVLMFLYGFQHSNVAGLLSQQPPTTRWCGENIGYGYTADQTFWFDQWWNSPVHHAVMMDPRASYEGDDIWTAPNGVTYATMELCG